MAANRPLSQEVAAAMKGVFCGVVLASDGEPEAPERLKKRGDLRLLPLLVVESAPDDEADYRHISGGILIQAQDRYAENTLDLYAVTRRAHAQEQAGCGPSSSREAPSATGSASRRPTPVTWS